MTGTQASSGLAEFSVRGLTVSVAATGRRILDQIDLAIEPGHVLGVVGESGSGKSTLVRCLIGAVAAGLEVDGHVELVCGNTSLSLLDAGRGELRAVRARRIAYLSQDPARSLTPTMRIGSAIAERIPGGSRQDVDAVGELLRSVGLPDDPDFRRRYPFAVSGGQAQRVALARALAADPDVLLLDEPTTGLDVVTQADLLDELVRQQDRSPRTMILVSHDLAAVARLAGHLVVLRDGRIVEQGPCREVFRRPRHPHTAELVAACADQRANLASQAGVDGPTASVGGAMAVGAGLTITGLCAAHRRRGRPPVVVAEGLDLQVEKGRCVALVGASGSGKSTIARAIVGAHTPDAGEVSVDGRVLPSALDDRDIADRWRVQMIPQDPAGSLDPRRRVGQAVGDVVRRCRGLVERSQVSAAVAELLVDVGLDPALVNRRPGELSGGERQRVAIARALAASPSVLLCDEVTSALDMSVQAGVIRLLRSLVEERGVAMLFITHDLGLIRDVADGVAVLHQGVVCERGTVGAVFGHPRHEVTRRLLDASRSLSAELE